VRIVLDAAPQYVIPAKVSFVASTAQFTPKTVETASERQKLMFRVKAQIDRELLQKHLEQVKTGLPGVAWVRLDAQARGPPTWPTSTCRNDAEARPARGTRLRGCQASACATARPWRWPASRWTCPPGAWWA
jgi:hypothetical protein